MIGFVGLSHLGIVYGLATAAKGFAVVGFDRDAALCGRLAQGQFPVSEPGLNELFAGNQARLTFTADANALAQCRVIFYSLDVPTDDDGHSDLAPLRELLARTAPYLAPDATAVILCQVPPGFTRSLKTSLATTAQTLGGHLHYQVETLVFGNAVARALQPERYIVGCDDPRAALPAAYAQWLGAFGCPVLPMHYESAELAKIAINFFLVSSVATTNTLAEVCEGIGADWSEIAPALRLDARIGPKAYLTPGLGISGGNLERDLVTVQHLAAPERGRPARESLSAPSTTDSPAAPLADTSIITAWQHNSAHRKDWLARTLRSAFARRGLALDGATLGIWGLAYKENTHSTKNSPSLQFIAALPACRKQAFDPVVKISADAFPLFTQCATPLACCRDAHALVIPTPWPEFRGADLETIPAAMPGRILLDPFGLLDGERAAALGFDYYRLGAPPLPGAPNSSPAQI
ncbi:UDP-glucose 6-dehydrogenase [Verrucomicrobiota bacterium]|nr:UDP-glucose 6-dehydrogenase [Verrucomicrobiota bacterium]